jgi:predicted transglutaminase-like cysteine proteinase
MVIRSVAILIGLFAAGGTPAAARSWQPPFLTFGDAADAPVGFLEMCGRDRDACGGPAAPLADAGSGARISTAAIRDVPDGTLAPATSEALPAATPDPLPLIRAINRRVNRAVRQRPDSVNFGVDELWRPTGSGPGATGDCEDIALEKRAQLIAAGLDEAGLFLAVVYRRVGLHTVLVARTATGDVVLDSLTGRVRPWARSGYSWLRLQVPGNPLIWTRPALAQG